MKSVLRRKEMENKKSILLAVGSSGGHIYPALAIAEKIQEKVSSKKDSPEIHFVCSRSSVGKKWLSSIPYPVHEISIGGLAKGQSFFKKIKTLFQLPKAFVQSVLLIKKQKAQVIFGTGGAVTGPLLMAGFFMFRKTGIWEGNAVMGLANRWLTPFVSVVFTVFPQVKGLSSRKQIPGSYPLRKKILAEKTNLLKKEEGSQEGKFKVLILGGSQGSVLINQVVCSALQEEAWRKGIFIYHQTGDKSIDLVREKYQSLKDVEAFDFSLNIEEYYKKSDLIFSRAGSGAIWETACYEKPLVLIPLTYSAGGHQLQNALKLSSENCVEMIKESDFNEESFKKKVLQLKDNKERRRELAQSLKKNHSYDGAEKIAHWILSSGVF